MDLSRAPFAASRVATMLGELADIVGQERVALWCMTDRVESVYLDAIGDDTILVSDHGETYFELSDPVGPAIAWNHAVVQQICTSFGIELVGTGDDHEGRSWTLERRVSGGDSVADAVAVVSAALDSIYSRHNRFSWL